MGIYFWSIEQYKSWCLGGNQHLFPKQKHEQYTGSLMYFNIHVYSWDGEDGTVIWVTINKIYWLLMYSSFSLIVSYSLDMLFSFFLTMVLPSPSSFISFEKKKKNLSATCPWINIYTSHRENSDGKWLVGAYCPWRLILTQITIFGFYRLKKKKDCPLVSLIYLWWLSIFLIELTELGHARIKSCRNLFYQNGKW